MNTTNQSAWDYTVFYEAATAVLRVVNMQCSDRIAQLTDQGVPYWDACNQAESETSHYWFKREHSRYALHPAVAETLRVHGAPASRYDHVLLEWPHISKTDPGRLAYTKDDRAGMADRQTITTVARYIKRHWPHLPDHVIRDLDARFNPRVEYRLASDSVADLITAVELGPRSCMKSTYGSIPFNEFDHKQMRDWLVAKSNPEPDWERHPYAVYDPRLGWGMATRLEDGEVVGRCLTWTSPRNSAIKVFVRSYKRSAEGESGYSNTDEGLEAWLTSQGFVSQRYWPDGAKVLALDHPTKGGWMVPYIDGPDADHRRVSYRGPDALVDGEDVLAIDHHEGEFTCDNTDGTVDAQDDDEDLTHCEDCGGRVHYEDTYSVGRWEDRCVCSSCFEDYIQVRGLNNQGRTIEYYLPSSDASPVYTSWAAMQDERASFHAPDDSSQWPADVTESDADGYEGLLDIDYAVRCTDGELRFLDDPYVVRLAQDCPVSYETYALRDDAWQAHDGKWFSDEEDYVIYEGEKYREDDCWQCDGTGLWFPDDVEPVEGAYGAYHPEYFNRCSRSAEWGDEEMADFREGEFPPLVPPLESPLPRSAVADTATALAPQAELALA